MAKVKCPNGHVFETAIYGNNCPLCNATVNVSAAPVSAEQPAAAGGTSPKTHIGGINVAAAAAANQGAIADPRGETMLNRPAPAVPKRPVADAEPRTVIRRPNVGGNPQQRPVQGRKLVGFLVTYNRNPLGKAYPIFEGRNYVGRDSSCDIAVPDDSQMSGKHMSILYRGVDHKFKFRDEQSSNGTFINKELKDDGELQNYDIIRVGGTLFIFVAIPQI